MPLGTPLVPFGPRAQNGLIFWAQAQIWVHILGPGPNLDPYFAYPSISQSVSPKCLFTDWCFFCSDGNQSGTPVRRHVEFHRKAILLNSVHYRSGASPEASDQSVNQSGSPEPVRDVFQTFEESPVRHHSPEPVWNQSGTSPEPVRDLGATSKFSAAPS